jgi:hypothetical protein
MLADELFNDWMWRSVQLRQETKAEAFVQRPQDISIRVARHLA